MLAWAFGYAVVTSFLADSPGGWSRPVPAARTNFPASHRQSLLTCRVTAFPGLYGTSLGATMAEPLREPLDFVFLWWSDSDHGVILSRAYHTLVNRFHAALRNAGTWGEFLAMLDDQADYVRVFMQCDETTPQGSDRLGICRVSGCWTIRSFHSLSVRRRTSRFTGIISCNARMRSRSLPHMACRFCFIQSPLTLS